MNELASWADSSPEYAYQEFVPRLHHGDLDLKNLRGKVTGVLDWDHMYSMVRAPAGEIRKILLWLPTEAERAVFLKGFFKGYGITDEKEQQAVVNDAYKLLLLDRINAMHYEVKRGNPNKTNAIQVQLKSLFEHLYPRYFPKN